MKLRHLFGLGLALTALSVLVALPAPAQILSGPATLAPGGRLVVSSTSSPQAPVLTADVANGTIIQYVPYVSGQVPVFNNGYYTLTSFGTNMQFTMAAANVVSGSIYDVFVSMQSGAPTMCTGPAWTNGTTRAAATALARDAASGLWVNNATMTGTCFGGAAGTTAYTVPALNGVYLGTIYANGNANVTWNIAPAAASHGSANILGVFNAYNRVHVTSRELSSTTSNTYATNTWHPADGTGQNLNTVTFIDGLGVVHSRGRIMGTVTPTNADVCEYGVNFNSTSATPGIIGTASAPATAFALALAADGVFPPTLGLNVIQGMENSLSAATCTFNATAAFFGLTADLDL